MYCAAVLYLLVVPSVGERFHGRLKLGERAANNVKELAQNLASSPKGLSWNEASQKAIEALAGTNPPKVDDVKQWAHFLYTKEGGGYDWKWANNYALEVLAEDHPPKLDDVKELAQHFNSTDTRWYSAGGSESPGGRARKALAGTNPPKVDDVKQWAHFLHTKEGGGEDWKWANIRALEVLAEDHPPKLDDVKELAQHFNSTDTRWYSAGGSESPGGRARKALAGTNPPKVDDVKQWAHFLHTKEGGGEDWKWANIRALEVLAENHPKLDDVKELAQHFNSTDTRWYSAGGSESPGGRAIEALAGTNPPKVDDVKQWAHFLHTKEGGGEDWKWANIRALEVLAENHPKLDDVKELAQHFALGFQDTVQPEAEPTRPVETTPEPLQMLDCDPPAKPRYGDLTGHVCKEGQSKIQHGQRCSPVCSLGHAPQPATLICDNGVIGSFECPEDIDNWSS